MKTINTLFAVVAFATLTSTAAFANHTPSHRQDMKSGMKAGTTMTSTAFKGIEVNGGTVTFGMKNGAGVLIVSSDFTIPKSPAPHWQVVDAKGNTYLLNQFRIAGDKTNLSITLPKYITSVSKVQVWCSFAEVVLGEAQFAKPMMMR